MITNKAQSKCLHLPVLEWRERAEERKGEVGGGSQPNKELFIVTDYFLGDSS